MLTVWVERLRIRVARRLLLRRVAHSQTVSLTTAVVRLGTKARYGSPTALLPATPVMTVARFSTAEMRQLPAARLRAIAAGIKAEASVAQAELSSFRTQLSPAISTTRARVTLPG